MRKNTNNSAEQVNSW